MLEHRVLNVITDRGYQILFLRRKTSPHQNMEGASTLKFQIYYFYFTYL